MSKSFIIFKHEFLQAVRRKSFIIITISLPLIVLLGLSIYEIVQNIDTESEPSDEQKIGYVDETGIFSNHTQQPDLAFIEYEIEDDAISDLLAEEIDEYFVIPPDYLSTGKVVRFTTDRELGIPEDIWWQIKDFLVLNLIGNEVSDEILTRAVNPLMLHSLYLDDTGEISAPPDELTAILVPYVFGLLFMMSIFFTSGYLLQSVSEEKENRIIEVLLSSVSAHQLLLGKIIGLGSAGLIQVTVWFITIRVFSDIASVNIPALNELNISTGLLLWGIIYFILGYLLFATIYAGLGSITTSARESHQMSSLLAMPAVLPLMLMVIIVEHPNGGVAQTLSYIPITAPTTIMMRLPNTSIPVWELLLSAAIIAGSIAIGIRFVAKIFRVYLLMYGKQPSLKDIIRYSRSS